jgi:hypothetical protein
MPGKINRPRDKQAVLEVIKEEIAAHRLDDSLRLSTNAELADLLGASKSTVIRIMGSGLSDEDRAYRVVELKRQNGNDAAGEGSGIHGQSYEELRENGVLGYAARTDLSPENLSAWSRKAHNNRGSNNWSRLGSIEDWRGEFDKHLEWQGRSTNEIQFNKDCVESGGASFYQAFRKWVRDNSGSEDERRSLVRQIFPERGRRVGYDFGSGEVYFDSFPERVVGIMLHEAGLVDGFEEGINLHVPVNSETQHSLDFKVGDTFIEYHPLSIKEKEAGLDLDEAWERKQVAVDGLSNGGKWFSYVAEVDDMYPVMRSLMPEGRDLSMDEFRELKSSAYRKSREYDAMAA